MFKKDIITQAYLNLITQGYYRRKRQYPMTKIVAAVKQLTNNGKDMWIKGETGKNTVALVKADEISTGIDPQDLTYIKQFFNERHVNNDFDVSLKDLILNNESLTEYDIGKAAYGIFLALNDRYKKQNNIEDIINGEYFGEIGQKVTANLKLIDTLFENTYRDELRWVHKPYPVGSSMHGFCYWDHPVYTTRMYKLEDEQGRTFICRTSSDAVASIVESSTETYVPMTFTVLGHQMFRDLKQTQIKIIAPKGRKKKIEVVKSDIKPEGETIPQNAQIQIVDEMDELNKF